MKEEEEEEEEEQKKKHNISTFTTSQGASWFTEQDFNKTSNTIQC